MTRREWLGAMMASVAPVKLAASATKQTEYLLQNKSLAFRISLSGDQITARSLTNKLANETVTLPAVDFVLDFGQGVVIKASDLSIKAARHNREQVQFLFAGVSEPIEDVRVRVDYHLSPSGPMSENK